MRQVNGCSTHEELVAIKLKLHVTDSQDPESPERRGIDCQVTAFLRCVHRPADLHLLMR